MLELEELPRPMRRLADRHQAKPVEQRANWAEVAKATQRLDAVDRNGVVDQPVRYFFRRLRSGDLLSENRTYANQQRGLQCERTSLLFASHPGVTETREMCRARYCDSPTISVAKSPALLDVAPRLAPAGRNVAIARSPNAMARSKSPMS